jgi:hypothetical protein
MEGRFMKARQFLRAVSFAAATLLLGGPSEAASLVYVPGSTEKLEQLIGDFDKQRQVDTANRTFERYRIRGTDLGNSFEHEGQLYFLFGDTVGRFGGDVVATSRTTDPEEGLRLDFLTDADGNYLKVEPTGLSMEGFEVPVAGISLGGQAYVAVKTNHLGNPSGVSETDMSVLTRFDTAKGSFTPLRTISRQPDGKVIEMSMHLEVEPLEDLPPGGPYVLIWSAGPYRSSDAYLSVVPVSGFETGDGTRYFAGFGADGKPAWSESEADAKPVVAHPTIGEFSVTWAAPVGMWLMTYASRTPRGIVLRYSTTPWGPWSEAQIIVDPRRDGTSAFIHQANSNDGLAGPVIGPGGKNPEPVQGGMYAPFVIERFTRLDAGTLTLYYVLSTWNPYVVVLMKSSLTVGP